MSPITELCLVKADTPLASKMTSQQKKSCEHMARCNFVAPLLTLSYSDRRVPIVALSECLHQFRRAMWEVVVRRLDHTPQRPSNELYVVVWTGQGSDRVVQIENTRRVEIESVNKHLPIGSRDVTVERFVDEWMSVEAVRVGEGKGPCKIS